MEWIKICIIRVGKQEPYAREYREGWGETTDGSMYTNGNIYYGVKLDIGVNRGGPLFFTHFSFMGLDPRGLKDKYTTLDYYNTLRNIVRINYRYCLEIRIIGEDMDPAAGEYPFAKILGVLMGPTKP